VGAQDGRFKVGLSYHVVHESAGLLVLAELQVGIDHVILGVQIIPTDFSASAAFTEGMSIDASIGRHGYRYATACAGRVGRPARLGVAVRGFEPLAAVSG